jgi:DNA polymerase III sliding clamp (beta) subunit (PCNA family)
MARLVMTKALVEIARMGNVVDLVNNDDFTFARVGGRLIIARKPSGNFPDFRRLMPKVIGSGLPGALTGEVELPCRPLQGLLERLLLFADERSRTIKWQVEDGGRLKLAAHIVGAASGSGFVVGRETVAPSVGAYVHTTGFNGQYVLDFIQQAIKQGAMTVRFQFGVADGPAQFVVEGWTYVVMPLRIDGVPAKSTSTPKPAEDESRDESDDASGSGSGDAS